MNSQQRFDRIHEIFGRAKERRGEQRDRYLDDACGSDSALHAEVESMLRRRAQPHPLLDAPLVQLAAAAPVADQAECNGAPLDQGTSPDAETRPARSAPRAPRRIGRYAIKSVLGSGGMGTVYLALQDTPRRRIALKVMKPGVASRSAQRRFEFEAQTLGRLRHPAVAQIFEAGKHDDGSGGVPYFAMEHIAGAKTLTAYADAKELGTRERLELFVKVCEDVHHGHQRGIIHRDLKPTNILVDSSGQPKIIDFGVARSTDSDLAVTTLQTDVGQLIGTLQYMSPEQCDPDVDDLDTRSDVYALVLAFSRPRHVLAKLGYPLSRAAQRRFGVQTLEAMRREVSRLDVLFRQHLPGRPRDHADDARDS